MNRTPLRLVAIEDPPPTEDALSPAAEEEQSGTPVAMMGEQDAVTRKVPDSKIIAAMDTFRGEPKRSLSLRTLLPVGAVAIVVMLVVVALVMKGKSTAAPAPGSTIVAQAPNLGEPPKTQPSAALAAPAATRSPRLKAATEIIRLEVVAEPMETDLSLDGNVVAGHRLNLEVPKDRGIHVVSASAPGYIPFNQQVSFSDDVVLKISLHRAHTPPVRQVAKPRPSRIESSPRSAFRPAAVPPGPGLAPGMNIEGPSIRPNAKPIDERNPYKP
ncbi:MAG TPA: hypothetical protein VF550_01350 [Polyangia bacterium]